MTTITASGAIFKGSFLATPQHFCHRHSDSIEEMLQRFFAEQIRCLGNRLHKGHLGQQPRDHPLWMGIPCESGLS
jgi:hypothetical protein